MVIFFGVWKKFWIFCDDFGMFIRGDRMCGIIWLFFVVLVWFVIGDVELWFVDLILGSF